MLIPPTGAVVSRVIVSVNEFVVSLFAAADDDLAAGAAVARAGRRHGVFAVIAARLRRQEPLPVLEHRAVLAVGEGAALPDQRDRLHRLGRQLGIP